MPRLRVFVAGLVLLTGTVLAAGCARTDEQAAGGQGVTTVTAPPVTSGTTSTVAPLPTPTTRSAPAPLLVWPYTTSVNVAQAVKVPPVPVLEHVRVGRHPGYDRIVFEFTGPLPGYRVQPATTLAEDGRHTHARVAPGTALAAISEESR
jgi:hypothetical protein